MNIQLTISLLASDRPDTLKKCLDSLTPFLKKLNSELIVVFTGKEQETLEIIRQYTSHIIPFTWCDDFSTNGLKTREKSSSSFKAENIVITGLLFMLSAIIQTGAGNSMRMPM